MRRTVIVIAATVAGLVGLLSFHTAPAHLGLSNLAGTSAARVAPTTTTTGGSPPTSSTTPGPTSTGATVAPTTTAPPTTRTVAGDSVNYSWGVLAVSVTATGHRITKVGIASLNDGGNPRSESIDQQSIPILEQQAMQAQSANIQGVSGASYTSAGFQQSLQSALSKLKL